MDMVELLLKAGANVNAKNEYDVTPLSLATENGSLPMVRGCQGGRQPESGDEDRRDAADDGGAGRQRRNGASCSWPPVPT